MRPVFRRPIGTGSGRRTRVGLAHFRRLEPGSYKYIHNIYKYIILECTIHARTAVMELRSMCGPSSRGGERSKSSRN